MAMQISISFSIICILKLPNGHFGIVKTVINLDLVLLQNECSILYIYTQYMQHLDLVNKGKVGSIL